MIEEDGIVYAVRYICSSISIYVGWYEQMCVYVAAFAINVLIDRSSDCEEISPSITHVE